MRYQKVHSLLVIASCLSMVFMLFGKTSAKAAADLDPANILLAEVSAGLTQPLFITNAGDGSGRLFIVERAGRIRIIKNGVLLSIPFLDIHTVVNSSSSEQGLLKLAFHPDYTANGQFYTVHTGQDGSLVLSKFTRSQNNPDLANANSMAPLLTIPHPNNSNHNGGTLAFGPDEYLYWSTGDGGGAGDVSNNAQNLTVLLGKILRLDVNSGLPYGIPTDNPFFNSADPAVRKEIWAYGLRNPWRFSFDRQTGDMFIGDVGQGSREEINFQSAASGGGENYGWRVMEGTLCYNPSSNCNQSGKILPVAEYDHTLGCSVTGGYVYRGTQFPSLGGYYFYGDYCSGRIFSLRNNPGLGWESAQLLDTFYTISTFGEDEQGELYLADYSGGRIYQLTHTTFEDVPASHMFYRHIEAFYQAGLTVGCSQTPLRFCPDNFVTRGEMAVFIERALGNFAPTPNPTGMFADVPYPGLEFFTPFIEEFYNDDITSGCAVNPLRYCPQNYVTRGEMAVFIERALGNFTPTPNPTGMFADVPYAGQPASFQAFIEEFYNDGITTGCAVNPLKYCPQNYVTRGEMAVFIVRAFGIPLP
ncbi:MAG: PQQ-dependent sugar dehydrogenase [Chloroflexota bacterium]